MRRISFRDLLRQNVPRGRVFFHNLWFATHNNPRMSALLPRLHFVDAHLVRVPARRLARGVAYRLHHATRRVRYRVVLGLASERWRALFTNDAEQIRYFRGRVVVDMDDPTFTREEVELLNLGNVVRFVVTGADAGERFVELGVKVPWIVIPQGVDLAGYDAARAAEIRRRYRVPGQPVAVYQAAWLLTDEDHGGRNALYNVGPLLEMWAEVRRQVPQAVLWLFGQPGEHLKRRLHSCQGIKLFGYVVAHDLPNFIANADCGLYPRRVSHVPRAAKLAEYLGCGVPVVGFDLPVCADVRESGAGLLVDEPRAFVSAVCRVLVDSMLRAELGARARAWAAGRNWDVLAGRYAELAFGDLV